MVYRKPGFYPLVIAASLGGCVHSSDRLETSLKAWVGKHPDQLVEQWGAPRSVYVMEKGPKVLTYEATEMYSRTIGAFYYRPEVYTASESCKVTFFTDASQKTIEKYSYSGSVSACYDMIRSVPDQK